MSLQIRRGTDSERQAIVFAEAEIVYTTDTKRLYLGDGITLGGNPMIAEPGPAPENGSIIFTSETEPVGAAEGDGWYRPSTDMFTIYESDAFRTVSVDYVETATNVNDGYF